jgi:hypothetical protein
MSCGEAAGICSSPSRLTSLINRFFAASLPFFFLRAGLAGDEMHNPKNNQLLTLRADIARIVLA